MSELTVGQELWYVPADRRFERNGHAVRVTKIGRKWANVDRGLGRIDMQTLWVDGKEYSSPGRCWVRRDAWEAEERRQASWTEFKRVVSSMWSAPSSLSETDIQRLLSRLLDPQSESTP